MTKALKVSARFAYHVPVPSMIRCYIDRFGRSVIYDEWNGKPDYVKDDEKKKSRDTMISQCLIGFSIILLGAIIGL